MKWFLLVLATGMEPETAEYFTRTIALQSYATQAECRADATRRIDTIRSNGHAGAYACVREDMTEAETRRVPAHLF